MKLYDVSVEDKQTHVLVVVGCMLSGTEANNLRRTLEHFDACFVRIEEVSFFRRFKKK